MRLDIALKVARICIFEVDIQNQEYTFFANAEDIFGLSGEAILADLKPYQQLSPDDYRQAVSAYFSHSDDHGVIAQAFTAIYAGKPTTYEARMKVRHQSCHWCRIDVTPDVEDGKTVRMIGVITDIDRLKQETIALGNAIQYDSFTSLYHKTSAIALAQDYIKHQGGHEAVFLLLDIDNFKQVNDTYGHLFGDEILLRVAQHIKQQFRKTDIVGRFGGDEFMVLVKEEMPPALLAEKLTSLLVVEKEDVICTCSIGIARYPQDGEDMAALMQCADRALYQAKRTKKAFVYYQDIPDTDKLGAG